MKGVGTIKHSTNVPQRVLGYDANALYNWCIGQEMPTGIGVIWEPDGNNGIEVPIADGQKEDCIDQIKTNDKRKFRRHSAQGFREWMFVCCAFAILQHRNPGRKLTLRHKFNGGQKSFRFGPHRDIYVDGWIPELQTILQFNGCFWHGHECHKTKKVDTNFLKDRQQHQAKIAELLKSTGCTLLQEYECTFEERVEAIPRLRAYVESHRVTKKYSMTQRNIIDGILKGELFGMVEVDIQVSTRFLVILAKHAFSTTAGGTTFGRLIFLFVLI